MITNLEKCQREDLQNSVLKNKLNITMLRGAKGLILLHIAQI